MNESIVEFEGVYKKFEDKEVFKDLNINIPKGKIVGLLGPHGSGKTTMIKMINGLTQCDKGKVKIN